jgi:hypothetical protein
MHMLKVRFMEGDARREVTIQELEKKTNEAMTAWFNDSNKPENMAKKIYLDEFFKIAKQQERYRLGYIDNTFFVTVRHGDDRTGIEAYDAEPEDGIKYEDDEAQVFTPQSSSMSSENLVSPHATHSMGINGRADGDVPTFPYALRDLPVRHFPTSLPPVDEAPYGENTLVPSSAYIQRSHYPQQNSPLDTSRRWTPHPQQPQAPSQHTYPSPTTPGIFGNWTATPGQATNQNQAMATTMSYGTSFPLSCPPPSLNQGVQAPYLPPPTTVGGSILPPMQGIGYHDGIMARPYDRSGGGMGYEGWTEGAYDGECKDEGMGH